MKKSELALVLTVGAAVVIAAIGTSIGTAQSDPVKVSLLAINDFHGNLLPSGFRVPDPADRTKTLTLQAGGVEAIATAVKEVKAKNPNTIVVGGGDLIGASPLVSSLLADEPSIDALSQIGMEVGSLGNHELDKGAKELLRMQKGGCDAFDPSKACKFNSSFAGVRPRAVTSATARPACPSSLKTANAVRVNFGIGSSFKTASVTNASVPSEPMISPGMSSPVRSMR